jgi:hypothetical protein
MVDADAGIARKRIPPIIPEGVDPLLRMLRADRVGPALPKQPLERRAALGLHQSVVRPILRLVDVEVGRDDIVVAGQHDRLIERVQHLRPRDQPLHPFELVVELRSRLRIAVGRVEAADQHAADRSLDIAALHILGIAGEPPPGLDRLAAAREDGDAVPARLAVPDRAVARFLDRAVREPLFRRLQLLQAHRVGRRFGQPVEQHRQPPVDPVHVEGRDPHGRSMLGPAGRSVARTAELAFLVLMA